MLKKACSSVPLTVLLDETNPLEDEEFDALLEDLGLRQAMVSKQDKSSIDKLKLMWRNLKLDADPETMASFEEMLSR